MSTNALANDAAPHRVEHDLGGAVEIELSMMCARWVSTVLGLTFRRAAISLLVFASATS